MFCLLAADNQRGHYTEVLAELGADRRLQLVRDLRAEAVEATAAATDARASAAATGSADAPASAARAEGAEAEEGDTEQSSSDSELPDTTAPAAAKAEERTGAGDAAPSERSPADVDMAADMTEAAVADPRLTVAIKRQRSSSTCPRIWKVLPAWSASRGHSPPELVRSTAGC